MTRGIPQGSVHGSLLFDLHMLPLGQILRNNKIDYHSNADDTRIYLAHSPDDYSPIDSLCSFFTEQINNWMSQTFTKYETE